MSAPLRSSSTTVEDEVRDVSAVSSSERSSYPYAVLLVLVLANVFNFIDRQLPYILGESIKRDLGLSDTQLGVLNGAAFSVVYATMAIPLARAADRWGSRWVLSGCIFFWSVMTSLGGLAQSFWQLAVTRVGVAFGEAGATPAAHAVISNYFPPQRRALPMGLFAFGISFGSMLGLGLGGWIAHVASWRLAFTVIAAPGLILALSAVWVIREPRERAAVATQTSLLEAARYFLSQRWFVQVFCAVAMLNMGAYALISFAPPFLMRTFGMNSQSAGWSLGLLHGIAGVSGALAGGWLGDRVVAKDRRWRLWLACVALLIAAPCTVAAFLAPSSGLSLVCMAAPKFTYLLYMAPTFALIHSMVPSHMRAQSSAAIYFGMGMIGLSLGPLVVGALSDYFEPLMGTQSLRYAMLFIVVTQVWSAIHFWFAARALPARPVSVECA